MPLRAVLLNEVKGNRITEWKKPAYFYLSTYDSWGGGERRWTAAFHSENSRAFYCFSLLKWLKIDGEKHELEGHWNEK